jgi:hypothetical protein
VGEALVGQLGEGLLRVRPAIAEDYDEVIAVVDDWRVSG